MFEKEAEEYARQSCFTEMSNPSLSESIDISDDIKEAVMFGYNKAKEDYATELKEVVETCSHWQEVAENANEWHKDLPTEDVRLAIIEVEDCGYLLCEYRNGFWYENDSGAICAEWITNNIVRWKEIVLPKED